ncbi:hypothetical protein HK101_002601 [Irineochytrium annulatum]|nr:hypothetical protein HK101_002601 [Irineochytrium annulatum]
MLNPSLLAAIAVLALAVSSTPITPSRRASGPLDWATATRKAEAMMSQYNVTLEEQLTLVTGVGWTVGNCVGNIAAIPRINFPGLCLQDSPSGIRFALNVSAFPAAVNVASTFDRTLMYHHGKAFGEEFRGKGVNIQLGPDMNIMRSPYGGRGWEGFGADPYLSAVASVEVIEGIQDQGVIATAKHYIANEQEHHRDDGGSSNIDDRTLHEIYLPPFKASVEAGVGAIMCSYNEINGTFACENPKTLSILKDEVGFKGLVMSDWWAGHSTSPSANSGLDMMMPGPKTIWDNGPTWWGPELGAAVKNGEVDASRVRDMSVRILATWFKMGQDQGFPEVNFNSWKPESPQINVQGDHKNHIRALGAASAVLLKNTGTLPLNRNALKAIAVLGSDSAANPDGPNTGSDRGVNSQNQFPIGTVAIGWGSGTCQFPYIVAPLDGIKAKVAHQHPQVQVISSIINQDIAAINAASAAADVRIVFANSVSGEGYINVDGNQGDRNNLTLWDQADGVVLAAAAHGPTVVVVHAPGAVDLSKFVDHPNVTAIIHAGFPGQETGNSIADVLFGDVNPSGRLPFTYARHESDYNVHIDPEQMNVTYSEGLLVDYRYFDAANVSPLYPFGHGLSYTSFGYSGLKTSFGGRSKAVQTISATIKNTGSVVGNEVVQLYLGFPAAANSPPRQLKGFDRVRINPGQSTTVQFQLSEYDVSIWDVATGKWKVVPGTYEVFVGASSRDIRLTGSFVL